MSGFRYLKGSCPVCGGARKDCRENLSNQIIHCRHDADPVGYVLKGHDIHGFGLWLPGEIEDEQSAQRRKEWIEEQRRERETREAIERTRRAEGLSEIERNREFRNLLNQLSLNQSHREDLKRRGLTDEQIQKGMFASVEQWQELSQPVSHLLPGVNLDGRSLNISTPGYLCPIWHNDLIIGCQIRTEDKYRWLTSVNQKRPNGQTSHLKNGELPIAVVEADGDPDLRFCEGVLKPYIASCRLGKSFLGAAGGNFTSSPEQIQEAIARIQPRRLILCPDAGAIDNPHVVRQYQKLYELLTDWGCELLVERWQDEALDIDEIPPSTRIALTAFEEFLPLPTNNATGFSTMTTDKKLNQAEYREAVRTLLEKNYSESELDFEVQAIASEYHKQDSQVWRAYNRLAEEEDKKEALQSVGAELDELLAASKSELNLVDYLPGELFKIKEVYHRLCLRPEVALMQFLTTLSGLLPVGSMINLCDYTNFDQALALFFAICAEPSQRKSPGQKQIVVKPLRILQKRADTEYKAKMENYELAMSEWKQRGGEKSGEPEPKQPNRRIYYINGATQAGLRNLLNKEQVHGLNIIYDEMAADFRNRSKKYNAGLTEDLLSYYDGLGKREALADGFAGDFDEVLLSVQGSIQPGVVAEFLNGEDDPNGYWSRISIVNQPNQVLEIPLNPIDRAAKIDISELLAAHYDKFARLTQPVNLRLSPEAENLMIQVMNKCDRRRVEAKTQGLAAQWGKLPGKIGRLAALIHLSEQLYHNSTIDPVVNRYTLKKAIKLGYFLLQEATSLYADNSPGNLAAHLKRILEEAEKTDLLAARDVKMAVRVLRNTSPNTIRNYFSDLERLGYGEVIGNGTRQKFKIKTVDNVDRNVVIMSTNKIHTEQGVQKTVDNVDNVDKIKNNEIGDLTRRPVELEHLTVNKHKSEIKNPENDNNDNNDNIVNKTSESPTVEGSEYVDNVSTKMTTNVNSFNDLRGQVIFDTNGNPHRVVDRNGQMWITDKGAYVSREDWRKGIFYPPTVQSVAGLINRIGTAVQLKWVIDNLNDLMTEAIGNGLISNEKLGEIYKIE